MNSCVFSTASLGQFLFRFRTPSAPDLMAAESVNLEHAMDGSAAAAASVAPGSDDEKTMSEDGFRSGEDDDSGGGLGSDGDGDEEDDEEPDYSKINSAIATELHGARTTHHTPHTPFNVANIVYTTRPWRL